MPRTQMSVLLLLLVALQCAVALRVTPPQATTPLSSPELSETERLVQEWTVAADAGESLQSILSGVACQVYVTYAPASQGVATVRVVGDNAAIMEKTVAVSPSPDKPGELRLQSPPVRGPIVVEGHVRVEIVVHNTELIHTIQVVGSGDVVVDNHVLVASNPVLNITAHTSASGDLYLPPQLHLEARTLHLQSSASGSIHVVAASVTVKDVEVDVTGSGDIEFGAESLVAVNGISVESSGSGATDLFFTRLQPTQLFVKASGSGDVTLARDATTQGGDSDVAECALKATGSGNVQTESLVCTTAQAVVSGSGNVKLTVRQLLTCKASGSGDISARALETSTIILGCKAHALPNPSIPHSAPSWMNAYSLPARKASRMTVVVDDEGRGHVDDDENEEDEGEDQVDKEPIGEDTSPSTFMFVLKPVVVVLLAISALALWQRRTTSPDPHQKANEKTRLLSEDTPVYI